MAVLLDRRHFLAAAAGSAAMLATGCAGSAALGGDRVARGDGLLTIGLTTALTGPYSEFGVPMKNCVDLAIKQANDTGGVLGRQVRLVSYDDQLVAETAQANMRRLLDEDNVDFVLAPAGSGPVLAVLPLVNAKGRIMMNTTAQTMKIVYPHGTDRPPYQNVFSFSPGSQIEGHFMGDLLARKFKKVGVVAESTPYGQTEMADIAAAAKAGGAAVVATESYDQGATDLTAQLARIRSAGAEAIAMVGLGSDAATARQTMARLGMMDTPFLISLGAGTVVYPDRARELVTGTIGVQFAAFDGGAPATESARELSRAYRAAYGNDRHYGPNEWPVPSFGNTPASSYDSVKVLLEGIKRAGSTDNAKIIAELNSGRPFPAARGDYRFSPQSHFAVTADLLTVKVFRAGPGGALDYTPYQA